MEKHIHLHLYTGPGPAAPVKPAVTSAVKTQEHQCSCGGTAKPRPTTSLSNLRTRGQNFK